MPFTPFDFNDEWASAWEWARMYRSLGLQVTPAHTPKGSTDSAWKRPVLDWTEFQQALVPDSLFARWYDPANGEHRQRRNMGVIVIPPTDPAEGWVFVVDLDVTPGKNGLGWWNGLIAVHANGLEPETPSQITGGGGRQMLFRGPPGWIPPTNKTPIGVDFRGRGGFWMAPPSMHASGNIYDWEPGREPWSVAVADAEPWLIEAIEKLVGESPAATARAEKTAPPVEAKSAFGRDIDGREAKLQAIAWAVVVDFRRASEALPKPDDLAREMLRAFTQYELTTKSRLEPRPGLSNADLLELEHRGFSELTAKIEYAFGKWDGEVAEAAKVPKSDPQLSDGGGHLGGDGFDSENPGYARAWVSMGTFHGDPPERRWLVPGWIPEGELCSMYGGGGVGKSLLAFQLAHCLATGAMWLGLETVLGSCLFVSCEDDQAELERRHAAIKRGLGHLIGNPFGKVIGWPRKGLDNLLAKPDGKGGLVEGQFMAELRDALVVVRPRLLILDTLADIYGGNEIERAPVNTFTKTYLGGLILTADAPLTILAVGHPSKSALTDGSGFSGSTAWENGVRSRLYLSRPENAGPDERILSRAKANYAGGDDGELALMLGDGVFTAFDRAEESRVAEMARTVAHEVASAWRADAAYVERKGHPRYLHTAIRARLAMPGQAPELIARGLRRAIDDGLIYPSKNSNKRGWRTPSGEG